MAFMAWDQDGLGVIFLLHYYDISNDTNVVW